MLLLLATSAAHALCASPEPRLIPAEGSTEVVTDVAPIWLDHEVGDGLPDLVMTDEDGEYIDVTVEWVETGSSVVQGYLAVPELEPRTTYTVAGDGHEFSFTTGDGPSSGTPELPPVVDQGVNADAPHQVDCETSVWIEDTPVANAWFEVDPPIAGHLEAYVHGDDGSEHLVIGFDSGVRVSGGGCSSNIDAMVDWSSLDVQVRAVDYAGTASDWSDRSTLTIPWPQDADCSGLEDGPPGCSAAAAPTALWLVVLPLILTRRR